MGVSTIHFNPAIGREESRVLGKQYMLASGGQDTELHIWIVETDRKNLSSSDGISNSCTMSLYNTLCGHKSPILAVKFNNNGTVLASASGDKTIRLWDPMKLTMLTVLEGPKRYVTSCAFSDDGSLLAAGSGDRSVLIWHVENALKMKIKSTTSLNQRITRFPRVHLRENKKLCDWTTEDVCGWLADHELAEYAHNFRTHAINGRELVATTDDILQDKLGVG